MQTVGLFSYDMPGDIKYFQLRKFKDMILSAIQSERETAVTILLFVIIAFWAYSWIMEKVHKNRHSQILTKGIESEAIVIDIGPTGRFVNNAPQLKVQIQVEPERGRNFVTEIKQVVPQVDFNLLRSGSRIIVKYDPTYPKEVVLMRTA